MNSLLRLTLKNIADKKVRFFLTTLSVLLGVMFTVGVFIFSDTLRAVFNDLSEDIAGRTDLSVRSQQAFGDRLAAPTVDPALAPIIEEVDGVQATAAGIAEFGIIVIDEEGNPLSGQAPTIGTNWVTNENMSNLFIAKGREPRDRSEFVMNINSVENDDLMIGDTYTIQLPVGPQEFTLVGAFNFADPDKDQSIGAKLVSFDVDTATRFLKGGQGWDQIDIDVASNADEDTVRAAIQQRVEAACDAGEVTCSGQLEVITGQEIQEEQEDEFNQFIGTFQTILLVFAGIILAISIFVIFNTFTIVLGQRVKEFGLMRALGTTGRQITTTVVGESVVVGLASSALGFGAGVGLAYLLRWVSDLANLDLPLDNFVILPRTIIAAFVIGTGVTLVSALVPALRTRRIPPMAALRDDVGMVQKEIPRRAVLGSVLSGAGIALALFGLFSWWLVMLCLSAIAILLLIVGAKRLYPTAGRWAVLVMGVFFMVMARVTDFAGGEQWMALAIGCVALVIAVILLSPLFAASLARAIGWPIRLVSRVTGKLSTENAARSPRRTTTTAGAIMIGLALVSTIGIASQSLQATWRNTLNDALLADWFVCTANCDTGDGSQPFEAFSPELANDLEALPEIESAVSYRWDAEGLAVPAGENELYVYSVFATDLGATERHLDLELAGGSFADMGEVNPDVHNVGVHEDIAEELELGLGSPVPVNFNSRENPVVFVITAIYSEDTIAGTSWLIDLSTWEQYFTRNLDLFASAITASGVSQSEARAAIDRVAGNYPQVDVQTKQEFNDDQVGQIGTVVNIVNVFLYLALVIAFIGVANTLALSVIERTRELGLLRAVGMKRGQMLRMVLGEGVIISVFGGVMGVGLGLIFGITIVNILPNDFISTLAIPVRTLVIYLIVAAVAGLIAALLPARRASRLNVLDAISNE